jgi:hypothetical protein
MDTDMSTLSFALWSPSLSRLSSLSLTQCHISSSKASIGGESYIVGGDQNGTIAAFQPYLPAWNCRLADVVRNIDGVVPVSLYLSPSSISLFFLPSSLSRTE